MNSDFSHDPADLPRLIAAAGDADLVLGSRYVAGGGVVNWGLSRRLLSRGGSWYARTLLGVSVWDLTGGFKCFRYGVTRSSGSSVTSPMTAASSPRASSSPTRASRRSPATAMSSPPLVCGS